MLGSKWRRLTEWVKSTKLLNVSDVHDTGGYESFMLLSFASLPASKRYRAELQLCESKNDEPR